MMIQEDPIKIGEEKRLERETNSENKVTVDRAVGRTPMTVDRHCRQQVTEKASVSDFRQA